jgi:hypothetical protein
MKAGKLTELGIIDNDLGESIEKQRRKASGGGDDANLERPCLSWPPISHITRSILIPWISTSIFSTLYPVGAVRCFESVCVGGGMM